jgi:hypothetical protein
MAVTDQIDPCPRCGGTGHGQRRLPGALRWATRLLGDRDRGVLCPHCHGTSRL